MSSFVDSLLGVLGFAIGLLAGLVLGYFVFIIYLGTKDAEKERTNSVPQSLSELELNTIYELLPELPLWVTGPDHERVDWFNKFFNYMWPSFNKAVCQIIRTSAEPVFRDYIGKYCIKSIYFERLTLGDYPPKIQGLKAQDSKEDELVLDLSFRWAGNGDITLAVKLLFLHLTAQLVDMQILASVRIVLKPFAPTFPCFSTIVISLMDKPKIDFGFKVVGGDTMSIPGIYHCVQEVVAKQAAKLLMWPQTYEIDVLDNAKGAAKKPVGILHVKVVRARNLLKMDFLGTSDPYVKLSLTGKRLPSKKTTVVMNNLNPVWNEDFKMIVTDPDTQILHLHLYDWEKLGAHDYLGMQVAPLKDLTPYETKRLTLDLVNSLDQNDPHNRKPRGNITVELTLVPFLEDSKKFQGSVLENGSSLKFEDCVTLSGTGLLLVTVVGAEDVEGKRHTNPYAKIVFRGEQRKTRTLKKTRDPLWNEEYQFMLDEAPMKEMIHIEVKSSRRLLGFKSKEFLGYVDINLGDIVYNEHINEKYNLINSKNGIIHLDIRWKVI